MYKQRGECEWFDFKAEMKISKNGEKIVINWRIVKISEIKINAKMLIIE